VRHLNWRGFLRGSPTTSHCPLQTNVKIVRNAVADVVDSVLDGKKGVAVAVVILSNAAAAIVVILSSVAATAPLLRVPALNSRTKRDPG